MLDNGAVDEKSVGFTIGVIMGVALFDLFTFFADEKLRQMPAMAMVTGDKGINRLNAVDKAKFGQKIQGAVNCRRLRRADLRAQTVQQIIGLNGAAIFYNQFKNMGAQGGKRSPAASQVARAAATRSGVDICRCECSWFIIYPNPWSAIRQ